MTRRGIAESSWIPGVASIAARRIIGATAETEGMIDDSGYPWFAGTLAIMFDAAIRTAIYRSNNARSSAPFSVVRITTRHAYQDL